MAITFNKPTYRVGGSGQTVYTIGGKVVVFARQVSHTSPQPVAETVAIHPLDAARPVELVTPFAQGMGRLTLEVYETYDLPGWKNLPAPIGIDGSISADTFVNRNSGLNDLVDVFRSVAINGSFPVTKWILAPGRNYSSRENQSFTGSQVAARTETYLDCVVTNIMDGEQISTETMEIFKVVEIAYRRAQQQNATGTAD